MSMTKKEQRLRRSRQTRVRIALQGDASTGLARTTQALFFLGHHGAAPYFFLVSLRETFSSE